jgi:hypothetical protein
LSNNAEMRISCPFIFTLRCLKVAFSPASFSPAYGAG